MIPRFPSPARPVALLLAGFAVAALLTPAPAAAQRQSGIQIDLLNPTFVLLSKDVGEERWSISFDFTTARGVVFRNDGSPPQFITCETLEDDGTNYFFDCWGAGPCGEDGSNCTDAAWTLIGTNLPIPIAFFTPPGEPIGSVSSRPPSPLRTPRSKPAQ
jgi:hypothetical protein